MIAAGLLFLAGLGMIALGLVEQTMYDIGIIVVLIASIGLVVRLFDLRKWLRS